MCFMMYFYSQKCILLIVDVNFRWVATFPIIYWKEPEWRVKVPMNEIIIFFINCVPELMMRWQRNCIWHHPILSGILTNKLFFFIFCKTRLKLSNFLPREHFLHKIIMDKIHSVWKSPKMSYLSFWIMAFSINFCTIKVTCLVTLFDNHLNMSHLIF